MATSKKKIALENAKNAEDVFKARAAADSVRGSQEAAAAAKAAAAAGADGIPGSLRSFFNKVPVGAAAKELGKEIGLAGAKALPVAGNVVSGGLAAKGVYDMVTDPSQRTLGRAAETALDAIGAIPVLGNASNALRFGSKAAQVGAIAAGGLRSALGTDEAIPPVSVNPAEVAALRAERPAQAAAGAQPASLQPAPAPTLEQNIDARAGRVEDLRGAVSDAQTAYDNSRLQGAIDSYAQRIPGMAAFALASQGIRSAPEAATLKSATRDYAMARSDAAHDDKVGLELGTLRSQQSLAQAKMHHDMLNNTADRVGKFEARSTVGPDGKTNPDAAAFNSDVRRIASDDAALAGETTPTLALARLQGAVDDTNAMRNYNDVASVNRRMSTAPKVLPGADTVGFRDALPGGAGLGAAIRAKLTRTPNEVYTVRTPDGQEQRILSTDLSGGDSTLRARYAKQAGLTQGNR
jgi:hypothetical protein